MQVSTTSRVPQPPCDLVLEIERPSAPHTHTMILLHDALSNGRIFGGDLLRRGLTSSGRKLTQLFPGVRFVFPTAPRRHCHAFGQLRTTLWFDVARLEEPRYDQELQRRGLCTSAHQLITLIQWEMRTLPPERIIIGGLGQGCAVSLVVLLSLGHRIGGVIGMSGFLPYQFELLMNAAEDSSTDDSSTEEDDDIREGANNGLIDSFGMRSDLSPTKERTSFGTPIFLGHGKDDATIACRHGELAFEAMRSVEFEVDWKTYDGLGHACGIPKEMDDIVEFLRTKVGLQPRM